MLAYNGPRYALISVRIAPIEFIAIVENNSPIESTGRIRSPLENHLGPIHPHVVVHPALRHHLALCGVPQVIVRLAPLELIEDVAEAARIGAVLDKGLARPG